MMRAILAIALLLAASGTAHAATLTGATWAEPETVTVQYDQFARDENGERYKDESGAYVREEQTFTLHWDMQLDCTSMTDPGEEWEIFAEAGNRSASVPSTNESWTILAIEPRTINTVWSRDSPIDPWTSSGSVEVKIINEQKPERDEELTYHWNANPWLANSCAAEGLDGTLDFRNHTIILPGFNLEEDGTDPEPRKTPGPALPLVLVGIAILAFKKR